MIKYDLDFYVCNKKVPKIFYKIKYISEEQYIIKVNLFLNALIKIMEKFGRENVEISIKLKEKIK